MVILGEWITDNDALLYHSSGKIYDKVKHQNLHRNYGILLLVHAYIGYLEPTSHKNPEITLK